MWWNVYKNAVLQDRDELRESSERAAQVADTGATVAARGGRANANATSFLLENPSRAI